MKTLLLLLFTCCAMFAFSQTKTDSLLNELNKHPEEDTVRYLLLKTLAYQYSFSNPSKGLIVADSAIALAKRLNIDVKVAGGYSNKATNLHKLGRDSEALALYKIAVNIHLHAGYKKGAANVYFNMAYIYFDIGNYFMAINYQLNALKLFKELNLVEDEADTYNSIGDNYMRLDDYPSALKYFMQALHIYEQLKVSESEAMVLSNIGMSYHNLSDAKKAMEYYKKALVIDEANNNSKNLAHDYQHIGILYDDAGDYDVALNYYKKSLQLNTAINEQREVAENFSNIAAAYNKKKDYTNAYININKALEIYTTFTDKYNIAALINEKGKLLAACPDNFLQQQQISPSKRYTAALKFQQQGLQLSKEIQSNSLTVQILQDISTTYEKAGMLSNALSAYKQSESLKDSIFNDDQKKQITRLEMQNEFDKKEAATKALNDKKSALDEAEIKKQKLIRNIIISTSLLLIIAAITSFIFYKKRKNAVAEKKEADLKTQVTETEMKALRAQMNPHFIFNSLNSIADYIDKNETQLASSFTVKFAKLMRMVLENSEHKQILLTDDLKALELYIQLEQFRLKNKFSYTINIDQDIDENTLVPPLILQPFVENSIWHGVAKKEGKGNISICIKKENEMICCIVEDDGEGIKQSATEHQKQNRSLGIRLTTERINIMNKQMNIHAGVQIQNKEEGVRAEIRLPFETDI